MLEYKNICESVSDTLTDKKDNRYKRVHTGYIERANKITIDLIELNREFKKYRISLIDKKFCVLDKELNELVYCDSNINTVVNFIQNKEK